MPEVSVSLVGGGGVGGYRRRGAGASDAGGAAVGEGGKESNEKMARDTEMIGM